MGIFSGRHFPREVILWAVRRSLPLRGELPRSRRNDDFSRGVPVDHTTILTAGSKNYAPELDKQTRWYRQVPDWQAKFLTGG